MNFPYFKNTEGIAAVATVAPGRQATLDLAANGRITSHLVKYSHHPDGVVLFTQDGKVRSEVRKQGVPLAACRGHLFTVHAAGPHAFEAGSPRDAKGMLPNLKRTNLVFPFPEETRRLKFVGWLYSIDHFFRANRKEIKPKMWMQQPDGSVAAGFACTAPERIAGGRDRILVVTAEEWAVPAQSERSSLMFLGGFDPPEIADDPSKPTQVLALLYPVEGADELRARLGSIDFVAQGDGILRDSEDAIPKPSNG